MLFPKLTHSPPKAAPKQSAPRTSPELWAEHTVKLPQRRPELPSWPRPCRGAPGHSSNTLPALPCCAPAEGGSSGNRRAQPQTQPSSPVPPPAQNQTLHERKAGVPGPGSHLRSAASSLPVALPCPLLSARPYQQRLPRGPGNSPGVGGQASTALTSPPVPAGEAPLLAAGYTA